MITDTRERIEALDDEAAYRLLATITRAQAGREAVETAQTPEIASAGAGAFAGVEAGGAPARKGDLTRAALLVLAADPRHAEAVRALVAGPATESFGLAETLAVVTAALVVLQTRVKLTRDKDGKLTLLIDKAAASDGLLKELVEKLLALASGRPVSDR